jgi:predicted RNA-binding Zn-ribbon protein involved in translation (DUF1610 family)
MSHKQKHYFCPQCNFDITHMANWEIFLEQHKTSIYCPNCNSELILNFEEFFGEAEERIEFYFEEAK